jgi:ABC-type phosphate transport system permease subunit
MADLDRQDHEVPDPAGTGDRLESTAGADVAAGGTGAVPIGSGKPSNAAARRKRKTSLASRGEPMVWLTGGCIAVAVVMIVTLLVFIAFNGFGTFWPGAVHQVAYTDDNGTERVLLGSIDRTDELIFNEDANFNGTLDEGEDLNGNGVIDDELALQRTLYKTGNFTLTDEMFTWVRDDRVTEIAQPEDALLVEWTQKNNLYGTLTAVSDGDQRIEGTDAAWQAFGEFHDAALALEEQIESINEDDLGAINDRISDLNDDLDQIAYNERDDGGEESAAYLAEVEQQQVERDELDGEIVRLTEQRRELEERRDQYTMEMEKVDGRFIPGSRGDDEAIPMYQVVRAFPANQLGVVDKVGVYFSRWGEFLRGDPRLANSEGGVWPAIVGTVMLTFIMVILVVPIGVIAAIYLREYARQGPLVSLVRISVNNLAGVPSIVYGVFGLGFFCYTLGAYIDGGPSEGMSMSVGPWLGLLAGLAGLLAAAIGLGVLAGRMGKSDNIEQSWLPTLAGVGTFLLWLAALGMLVVTLAVIPETIFDGLYAAKTAAGRPTLGKSAMIWASLTLALLTLPVVIVATEEALSAVPDSMRQGSYACGASKWQTIRRIVLPRALPGIMTGMILAIARGAGEVAPLMLVGAVKWTSELPVDLGEAPIAGDGWFGLNRSFMHLGFHIYDLGFQSQDSVAALPLLYTTVLLLITIVVSLNIAAILIRSRLRRRFAGGAF